MENVEFEQARQHLANLSDEELKARFWELAEQIVQPMLDLGREYTSPSIERSVLLRMGISSIQSTEIVNRMMRHNLMGKGAGHAVYRIAQAHNLSIKEAGEQLAKGEHWQEVVDLFKGGQADDAREVE